MYISISFLLHCENSVITTLNWDKEWEKLECEYIRCACMEYISDAWHFTILSCGFSHVLSDLQEHSY